VQGGSFYLAHPWNVYQCNQGVVVNGPDCTIIGGMADTNYYAGVYARPTMQNLTVVGTRFRSNSVNGTGLWPAVMLGDTVTFGDPALGTLSDVMLVGIRVEQQQGGTQHAYAVSSACVPVRPTIIGGNFNGGYTTGVTGLDATVTGAAGANIGLNGA
jgi:hypothetical protein